MSKLYLFYGKNIIGNLVSNLVAYIARQVYKETVILCVLVQLQFCQRRSQCAGTHIFNYANLAVVDKRHS